MDKRRVAIFDIDGTIFRSSLLIELVDALIQEEIFPQKTVKEYARAYNNWLDRRDSYDKYIGDVVGAFARYIKGVEYKAFKRIAKKVVNFHQNRVYRFTRDLVRDFKKKNYYLLAISSSPREVVDEFCKKFGFTKVYARIYEVGGDGKFTGKILYEEIINDKAKTLKRAVLKNNLSLRGSVGVGDSEGDARFLKMVEKPICFNPNSKLYSRARRAGWQIIVERKDVIYEL